MKRNGIFLRGLIFALAGIFVFGACGEDDVINDGPQISFANGIDQITLDPGVTSWQINATITSTVNLDEVVIYKVVGLSENQLQSITDFPNKTSYSLSYTVTNITENMSIKISATDKDGITNSKSYVITFTPAEDELLFWTGTLAAQLGAQDNTTLGSALATSTGTVYLAAAAKTNSAVVDAIYYYKDTDAAVKAEIISPKYAADNGGVLNADTWTTKNDTKFKKVTVTTTAFDAIPATDDSEVVTAATGFTEHRVTNLVVGDVFAIETASGKLGLAKVTALSGTTAGSITVEVKVQK